MIDSPYMASTGRSTAATPRATRSAASRNSRPPTATTRMRATRLVRTLVVRRSSIAASGAADTAEIVTDRGGRLTPAREGPCPRRAARVILIALAGVSWETIGDGGGVVLLGQLDWRLRLAAAR